LAPDFNRTIHIDIPITTAGAFAFYTTYTPLPDLVTGSGLLPQPTRTPLHYIDVAPKIMLGREVLPLDSLSVFSVVSKFMGKYPTDWDKHLRGIGERGYNMVHFSPLQHRGESDSPYSLYDQLKFDPTTFPHGEDDIIDMIDKMEDQYGLLGLTDVVWNHTANNSKWLEAHRSRRRAGQGCH
jgi:glycogen debranching enzyme